MPLSVIQYAIIIIIVHKIWPTPKYSLETIGNYFSSWELLKHRLTFARIQLAYLIILLEIAQVSYKQQAYLKIVYLPFIFIRF